LLSLTDDLTQGLLGLADQGRTAAPPRTASTLPPIKVLISRAALALRWARLRTSDASTAKPRPCSPARAASTAALSARILVWKAMPSITPMMSAILLDRALISPCSRLGIEHQTGAVGHIGQQTQWLGHQRILTRKSGCSVDRPARHIGLQRAPRAQQRCPP
jgi:hypothetical protein